MSSTLISAFLLVACLMVPSHAWAQGSARLRAAEAQWAQKGGTDQRIIGGQPVSLKDNPWQVGILAATVPSNAVAQFCGGSGGGYKGLDWARTGDVLAFSVGCFGSQWRDTALYILDLAGGPPVRITGNALQQTWSPDDASILYSDWGDGLRLRRINLATGVVTMIGNKRGSVPDWRRY